MRHTSGRNMHHKQTWTSWAIQLDITALEGHEVNSEGVLESKTRDVTTMIYMGIKRERTVLNERVLQWWVK